jgi:hypothetical protein
MVNLAQSPKLFMCRALERQSRWLRLRRGLIVSVLFIVLASAGCWTNPGDQQKLDRLHEIVAKTPLYPDFKQISASEAAKNTSANVSISYNSAAAYDDVKQFYIRALTSAGWEFVRESQSIELFGDGYKELLFRRGEDRIAISYRDGNKYTLTYCWGCY